jgi:hypothetical protein
MFIINLLIFLAFLLNIVLLINNYQTDDLIGVMLNAFALGFIACVLYVIFIL